MAATPVYADPVAFVDRYPVARLFAPPVATSADFSNTAAAFSLTADWSTSATVSTRSLERLVFDAESITLTGRWQWQHRGWRFGVDVPLNYESGGVLDRPIDEFHQLFGLPEGDRPNLPLDDLQILYTRNGTDRFDVQGNDWGLGETHVHVGRALTQSPGRYSAWRAHLKLPTGSTRRLFGSGTFGAGVEWHGMADTVWRQRSVRWFGGAGVQWHDGSDLLSDEFRRSAAYAHAGVRMALWPAGRRPNIDAVAQVDVRSAYIDSDLDGLGNAYALSVGGRWNRASGDAIEFVLVEDIVPRSVPDVIFQVRWQRGGG